MRKRILLADFDNNNIESIKFLLSDFDADIDVVYNGEDALKALRDEDYDLLIASAILPRINGFELTRRVRMELGLSEMPIFLISSIYKGSKYRYDAIHIYGATDFFELPLVEKEFLKRIKEFIPVKAASETMRMTTLELEQERPEGVKLEEPEELEEVEEAEEVEEVEELEEVAEEAQEEEKKLTAEDIFGDILAEMEGKPLEKKEKEVGEEKEVLKEEEKKEKKKEEKEEKEGTASEEIDLDKFLEETLAEELEEIGEHEITFISEEEEKTADATAEMPVVITPAAEKKIKEKVLGDYILLEKITTGGMAEIYKAKKKGVEGFEKIVALKKILPHLAEDEEFITMFIDEAKLASKLTHPNIVQIYELGKIDGTYYIAMEYVHGKDLRTILKKLKKEEKSFPIDLAAYIALKMCEALDYAHRKVGEDGKPLNIVHRDVSPQNILISYDGEIKLVDFGVAKASIRAHQTVVGSLKGKLLYMSPEQARGGKVDHRSDIFGLGTVLYELVTGQKAFWGASEAEVLEKVRNTRFDPPRAINPDIPEELERIILKAMEADLKKRYGSAADMRDDLERFLLNYRGSIPNYREMAGFIRKLFADEIDEELVPVIVEKEEKRRELEKKREPLPEKKEVFPKKSFSFEEEEKQSSSAFFYILLGIILIALLIAGFLYFKNKKAKSPAAVKNYQVGYVNQSAEEFSPLKREESKEEGRQTSLQEEEPFSQPSVEETTTETVQAPVKEEISQLVKKVQSKSRQTSLPPASPPKKPLKKSASLQSLPQKKVEKKIKQEKKTETSSFSAEKQMPQKTARETSQLRLETPPAVPEKSKKGEERNVQKLEEKLSVAEPQLKEGSLMGISEVDVKPVLIKKVVPRRPPGVRRSGTVFMMALISEKGMVEEVRVIKGINEKYNNAAIKAVLKWRFKPALKNGIKVKVWMPIQVKF